MKLYTIIFPLFIIMSATAQAIPTGEKIPVLAVVAHPKMASEDTVQALQKLFKSRRTRGTVLLGVTWAAVVATNVLVSNDTTFPTKPADGAILATGIALLYTVPLWVVGISQQARFSKKKERLAIDDFTANHRINPKTLKRLRPYLFADSANK